ncbi:MAG: isoprenylcysteine carboxylmethyltransferase family protein [Methanotrichaceae archaeon]|nr:isoprenylcysteine carboxylmethyltransferase family protein [Methanotrichaceae archaeon]
MKWEVLALDYFSLYAALYLVGFAALHSLLASLPAKKMMRKHFGPKVDPWYPVLFSTIAVITILPLAALLIQSPGPVLYVVPQPWIWLFFLAQFIIGLASLRAFLDAPHRFLIRAQLARPQSPGAFALGIKGIYCWIRDPFLLSGLLLIWLTPFMTENLLLVYLIASVYLFLGSLHWESRLLAQFGEEYAAYQNTVPHMIPQRNKRWKGCSSTTERK